MDVLHTAPRCATGGDRRCPCRSPTVDGRADCDQPPAPAKCLAIWCPAAPPPPCPALPAPSSPFAPQAELLRPCGLTRSQTSSHGLSPRSSDKQRDVSAQQVQRSVPVGVSGSELAPEATLFPWAGRLTKHCQQTVPADSTTRLISFRRRPAT